jgi:hypothetical protein
MSDGQLRFYGALRGFAYAGLPGALGTVVCRFSFTTAFVDAPLTIWFLAVVTPGILGALVGGVKYPTPLSRNYFRAIAVSAGLVFGSAMGASVEKVDSLKLVVFGVDGATWEQIDAFSSRGLTPNLARVRRDGATGTMRAQEPLFSPLLWTSMAAGKPPSEHGVHGFRVHADDARVPRFFEIAQHEGGHRVGVYKWLVTWPPQEMTHGGFMVPAWLAPTPETAPESLSFVKELELSRRLKRKRLQAVRSNRALTLAALGQGMRFSTLVEAAKWLAEERIFSPSEDTREVRLNMLRAQIDRDIFAYSVQRSEPAVATFTYYPTDALGHRFWKYHEPEKYRDVDPVMLDEFHDAVTNAYLQADEILGEVFDMMPENARLVVVSDHGFQALNPDTMGSLAVPRTDRLEERLKSEVGAVQVARVGTKITLVPDCAADAPTDCPSVTHDAVMVWVESLLQESTGLPLYKWEPVPDSPHAVAVKLREERIPVGALETDRVGGDLLGRWATENTNYTGDHALYGIFAALGPGVTPGATANVGILDIAPTLLAAIDLGKGEDMVGTVPPEVWPAPAAVPSWDGVRAKVRYLGGEVTEDDVNTEMLQMLGYLDE